MLAAAMLTLQHSLALLQCLNRFLITQPACVLAQLLQSWPTLCDPVDCSPSGASVHGDSPGKYTRVGCHALLQGTFPIRRLSLQISCSSCGPPGKPPSPNSCCCFSSPLLLPSCLLFQVCVHCRKITNWVSTRKRINTRSHDLILIRIFSKYIYIHTYVHSCLVTQSCIISCNLVDCSLLGSSVHGNFQVRILEWVATSSSRGSF